MNKHPVNMTRLAPDVQALFAAQSAELARKDAELMGLKAARAAEIGTLQTGFVAERDNFLITIQNRDTIIADLRMQLDGHKKHRFGSRSESAAQMELALALEEDEIGHAAKGDDDAADEKTDKPKRTPRTRKEFPANLERIKQRIIPSEACMECGGAFKELGVDVTDELEYIPGHFAVKQLVRPRLACTCCNKIVQSEMPSRVLPKCFVGPALMAHIRQLYGVEKLAKGKTPEERVAIRQEYAKPIFDDLEAWLKAQLPKVSTKSPMASAISYALKRILKARSYLDNGFLELDNNTAERAIRPVTLGRKNYLFMGSEAGGDAATIACTLMETCKLNNVDPEAWLAWVLAKIQDHPATKMDELLPWAYQAMMDERKAESEKAA